MKFQGEVKIMPLYVVFHRFMSSVVGYYVYLPFEINLVWMVVELSVAMGMKGVCKCCKICNQ